MEWWWLGYVCTGATVGLLSGLLGIGGGAVMVPMLVALFDAQGLPKAHILHLAVGTGLATILFTSASSVRAHAARGAVRWDIALGMTPGILAGGLIGSAVAAQIPTKVFAIVFCAIVYAAATNILLGRPPKVARPLPGRFGLSAVGFVLSLVSVFAAVGGAFLSIPFMLWCGVPLLQAIGTSAVIGFPVAISGGIGFIVAGLHAEGLPAHSFGYVYLPALLGVVAASVCVAPLGAALAHRLPVKTLQRIFAGVFYVLATRMLIALW
jgi:uncharacterized membrane protein YfcA